MADKTAAFLHQTFLEDGPTVEPMRKALGEVRAVIADLGTEAQIANARVPIGLFLETLRRGGPPAVPQRPANAAAGEEDWLFPHAFHAPGVNRLLDWVARLAVQRLPWWPAWLQTFRQVSQYLSNDGWREALWHTLHSAARQQPDLASAAAELRRYAGNFATWRWHTLNVAVQELPRVASAFRTAWRPAVAAGRPRIRDAALLTAVDRAVDDEDFWAHAEILRHFVQVIESFRKWCAGCSCHEGEQVGAILAAFQRRR